MALLFMDGFEGRDPAVKYDNPYGGYNGFNGGNASVWGGGRFTGTSYGGYNYAGQGAPYLSKLFSPATTITVGVATYNTNPSGQSVNILRVYGDNGATQHISVQFNAGRIYLYRGGTVLGSTGAAFVAANTWGYLELQVKVDSTVGSAIVRYNGATIITFSGNTKNGGTASQVDAISFIFDGPNLFYVDDVYILDDTGSAPHNTFLGDVRVQTITPSAAGSSTQFTSSAGANYTAVDELPASEADYVTSGTSGQKDLYALADIGTATNVYGLQTNILARKTDSGPMSIRSVVRSSGTDYTGTSKPLVATSILVRDLTALNPATSTAWTQTSINALEAGVEIV